jgi:hypothetical protein
LQDGSTVFGEHLPAKIVVYVAAIEMALHAWDIVQACRTDRPKLSVTVTG